jgi:hypothetical protein
VIVTFNVNGQFSWVQADSLMGQSITVQGSYMLAPIETGGFPFLTMVSQGQIFIQGLFAKPRPSEFLVETTTTIFAFFRQ